MTHGQTSKAKEKTPTEIVLALRLPCDEIHAVI